MRRYAGALIALVVFVVLLLFVLLTQGNNNSQQTASNATPTTAAVNKDLQVLSLGTGDTVTGLEIKTVTNTLQLKLDNNQWKETAPTSLGLDSAVVSDTVQQITALTGASLIPADKATNLPVYGLDKPTLSVTLQLASGPKTLLFGALNPATNNYYLKRSDDARVWTVSSFVVNTLMSWSSNPPTPAPTIAITGSPLTPLPSVTPSPTAGATTAGSGSPGATTPPVSSPAASTTAATTTGAATTAAATTGSSTTPATP